MNKINDKVLCYLSPAAQQAYEVLTNKYGLDSDLAVEFLEGVMPDNEMYIIPEDAADERK